MITLKEAIQQAQEKGQALGHFNISDFSILKGIVSAAQKLNLPVIIGVSEGERDFLGVKQTVALIKSLREEYDLPIFLNADHTHSLEKVKEAAEAGFDTILFDAGQKDFEENLRLTKEAAEFVKNYNQQKGTEILIEGELGYIGSGSVILEDIPQGAAIRKEDLTTPEQAERFVRETNIDLLAPAVGNLHGMLAGALNPSLDIERISEIKKVAGVPLVLHGGSGISNEQLKLAIKAGASIIHISTELRVAWKRGLDLALLSHPNEIVPYKLLPEVVYEVEKVVLEKLRIFSEV